MQALVLVTLENPINRRSLQPKSQFHNALKEAGLINFKFVDTRSINKTLRNFFQKNSVEGFNTISVDYIAEHRQALDEPTKVPTEKTNRLASILEDYKNECADTRVTPK